jgi:proteic killer suppression protein
MIGSFGNKKTERFFGGEDVRDFRGFASQAERRLSVLENAESLLDLRYLRSNRLEALSGDRAGQYSIRINKQWRICFTWDGEHPEAVEIVDYH